MSKTPVRQQHFRLGVALYGALFVVALALLGISIRLVILATAWKAPIQGLVATVALLVGTGAFCVWTGAAVFYQARSKPSQPGARAVVWSPPLLMRVAIVVIAVSLGIITAALATASPAPSVLLILGMAFFAMTLIASRFFVLRFEANEWGIACTGPLTTVRIPWNALRPLQPRGGSALFQRIALVTEDGREPMLWVVDPRLPISRDAARILVAELEAVRQSAAKPGA